MSDIKDVAVIGAGPSGLVSLKALVDKGLSVQGFDGGSRVGGIWARDCRAQAAYENLTANTSKPVMTLLDHTISEDYALFPTRKEFTQYIESYADRFSLPPKISFGSEIASARRDGEGLWQLSVRDGADQSRPWPQLFRSLVVATGQSHHPKLPDLPGSDGFDIPCIHAQQYWNAEQLDLPQGARVLVVGLGASAVEIAMDLARALEVSQVVLSSRSGRYLLPKFIEGERFDTKALHPAAQLPAFARLMPSVAQRVTRRIMRKFFADMGQRYLTSANLGLPEPTYAPWEKPASISDDIRPFLERGSIRITSGIRRVSGAEVIFEDGDTAGFDRVVFCTGYRWRFPFLTSELEKVGESSEDGSDVGAYAHLIHAQIPELYFVGMLGQTCSILPVAEQQAKWLAAYLTSDRASPARRKITREAAPLGAPLGNLCNFYVQDRQKEMQRFRTATALVGVDQ